MQHIFISGAGSGLGLALARVYAARGDVVALADVRSDRLDAALAELAPGEHVKILLDVGNDESFSNAASHLAKLWPKLDVLINNAGVASSGDFLDTSMAEWDRVMNLNVSSVQRGCKFLLPMMLPNKRGVIINVASFAGLAAAPDTGVYGVSKAAVLAYSEILRGQLFAHGLTVSCLCPSFFQTNLLESFAPGHDRMRRAATKMMETGALSANDVAEYTVRESERSTFLLLPHPDTRMKWRIKRWLPEYYFKKVLQMTQRLSLKPGKAA